MFIDIQDFKAVISDSALNVIAQADPAVIETAIFDAIEEIAGYLRPVYDTTAIFSASKSRRNSLLVMYAADIALYHMSASLPQKMGAEIRKERYDRAIKWLEGVQAGRIVPDLPLIDDSDGNGAAAGISFHSAPKLNHDW